QKRLPRNGYLYSGVLHMFIFGAFMVLSVDTINFILDGLLNIGAVVRRAEPGPAFHLPGSGTYYQGLADTFRFLCMVGLGMAFVNRTVIKPKRLPLTRDAMYTIFFIFGLMLFEVMQQGFDMALNPARIDEQPYIWFSGLLARATTGMDEGTLKLGYQIAWWGHLLNLLAFSNYVPFSKHSHVFAAPPNIFFMGLGPKGQIRKMDLTFDDEGDAPEYFGAKTLEDLSWKQLFDGLACTECGRCTDNCPASLSDKPLKPMHIIVDLKHHMEDRYKALHSGEKIDLDDPKWHLTTPDNKGVIDPDVLWSCTTCRACMEVCPVGNEHIPDIIDMRRYLTMGEGAVGHGAEQALKKMDRKGNPWGLSKNEREKWTKELDFEVKRVTKEPAEYLYWVGCAGALDARAQKVTQSMARLMKKAGVDFGILGKNESCTGDSARRLGDEYLFQQMAEKNVETLNKAGVKKIVTHCPHCFNTLKNEYTQFGGHYEVIHHSELLSQLVQEGKLKPGADGDAASQKVVYHDSCYLGRYNEIYDPQRDLIDAMPGVTRVESERHHQKGLCCGAGGGQMWMEMDIGQRINYVRTDELLETKPDVIAVACNFCMTMVDDGVKARSQEEKVKVLDLAEMLDRRTGDVPADAEA
ncbi:MAG: (Fe-S)-binding protein, partial [Myxococcales bacterium]|nr:(Fe-S)-binding protein [Myxococcales bacterium]